MALCIDARRFVHPFSNSWTPPETYEQRYERHGERAWDIVATHIIVPRFQSRFQRREHPLTFNESMHVMCGHHLYRRSYISTWTQPFQNSWKRAKKLWTAIWPLTKLGAILYSCSCFRSWISAAVLIFMNAHRNTWTAMWTLIETVLKSTKMHEKLWIVRKILSSVLPSM